MNSITQTILQRYNLTPADLLGQGMEATVYRYDPAHVLKIYQGTANLERLQTLQTFYTALDPRAAQLQLPQILELEQVDGALLTIEKYFPGRPMAAIVAQATAQQLPQLFDAYLQAALELQKVRISPKPTRYKLFDEQGLSACAAGDFHAFLGRWLTVQVQAIGQPLARNVQEFPGKLARLHAVLAQPYRGALGIVHGDFFPGNLLLDQTHTVTALIDFGLFTMFGDPLFDIATGWVFFDMYDEYKLNIRARLLDFILAKLGAHILGRLQLYVLLFSILGANAYSNCTDGHYAWCVMNLNDPSLWKAIDG
ncbi:MAG: aminoglycoside phosphotransferase family protein [Chloroflexi bacterium]|nr:aminoglycoside phosphotransferase family protein [Chloroflexota bacterium]